MVRLIFPLIGVIALLLLIFLGFTYYSEVPSVDIPQNIQADDLEQFLTKVISENNIPGVAAATIDKNGIRLQASSGLRKSNDTISITDNDQFHLGSCTKAMTAVLVAMHIDEGLLTWNTTVGEVLNDVDLHQDYTDVTVLELLNHLSGLPANAKERWAYQDLPIIERRLSTLKADLKLPASNEKGSYKYSNLGYTLAACILERLTGKSWESLMTERIFEPLEMTSAGFGMMGTTNTIDQPWGHRKTFGIGDWVPMQDDNPASMGPSGNVHCTIEDWGKFIAFQLLRQDTSLLSIEQHEQLLTVNQENYASGWIALERTWAKGKAYTHAGSNTMNFALAWVAPELERAYLVCTNSNASDTHQICDGVIGALLKIDDRL